jgi:prevent-host-death family protein
MRWCASSSKPMVLQRLVAILYKLASFKGAFAMISVTSMEAQNRFGQLLDTVQREPVTITRHGRTAAYMVSALDMQDFQNWQAARPKQATALGVFAAHFAQADAKLTPAARELTDEDVVRMVK